MQMYCTIKIGDMKDGNLAYFSWDEKEVICCTAKRNKLKDKSLYRTKKGNQINSHEFRIIKVVDIFLAK